MIASPSARVRAMARAGRGFTFIETLIALVVLAIASVGALSTLIGASRELKEGETRQVRTQLLDATAQRWVLASKAPGSALALAAVALGTSCPTAGGPCSGLAIGAAPWHVDATAPIAGDLSTGAYFTISTDGEVQQLGPLTVPPVAVGTQCGDAALPTNVYCRETLITSSTAPVLSASSDWTAAWPPPASPMVPATSTVYTVWVRVSKSGDTPAMALANSVYFAENFIQ